METQTQKFKATEIIYSSDMDVMNFLADNAPRIVLKDLDDLIKDSGGKPGVLLHNCPPDMVVVIMYRSPFLFVPDGQNLVLFAHNSVNDLIRFFNFILRDGQNKSSMAIKQVLTLLYHEKELQEENNTMRNFMG